MCGVLSPLPYHLNINQFCDKVVKILMSYLFLITSVDFLIKSQHSTLSHHIYFWSVFVFAILIPNFHSNTNSFCPSC